ncbi:DUF3048 domain-containing protein [Mesobacillus zeae]|uniref:DUF3048 domain-containing protein n=1 Tax=Mesobacillus zeae TaxID=1917180 RepID=A0A398B232_9BACI|nr:DUF3048 domain-containing protein [Mesobacillus zeae]RID81866.1 DUF3048 domain-containing protein [Mesobacillus zeae]
MMRKWITVAAAAVLILTGCGNEKDTAERQKEKKTEKSVEEKVVRDPYQFPLTGKGTKKEAANRAVAVTVNNHPLARPQSGLHKADIVYEVLAEGNVTRFLAIFESQKPEKVGPIRSARDYFIDLAKGYDSLYIAHGYSEEAKKMLTRGDIDSLNGMQYDGTLFKRASFRKAPHNSYITFDNIMKGAKAKGYSMKPAPAPLSFYDKKGAGSISGQDAMKVKVSYGDPSFTSVYQYDENKAKYSRMTDGEEIEDLDSGKPVMIENLFIVEATHSVSDNEGHKDIDLESGGRAYLVQKGKMNEVEWRNAGGRILPFVDGSEAAFVPGRTWISIVPSLGAASLEN